MFHKFQKQLQHQNHEKLIKHCYASGRCVKRLTQFIADILWYSFIFDFQFHLFHDERKVSRLNWSVKDIGNSAAGVADDKAVVFLSSIFVSSWNTNVRFGLKTGSDWPQIGQIRRIFLIRFSTFWLTELTEPKCTGSDLKKSPEFYHWGLNWPTLGLTLVSLIYSYTNHRRSVAVNKCDVTPALCDHKAEQNKPEIEAR